MIYARLSEEVSDITSAFIYRPEPPKENTKGKEGSAGSSNKDANDKTQ